MHNSLQETLLARGPHASLGAHAETYQRVMGSWLGRAENHMTGKPLPPVSVEAHFAWVLEGRAVEDVWIAPARAERVEARGSTRAQSSEAMKPVLDWYGATLRMFDPAIEAWRTTWTCPVSQLRIELIGRRQGDDIVQIGTRDGRPIRWTFSNIRPESFTWQGHILGFDGVSWQLEVDIQFQRLHT